MKNVYSVEEMRRFDRETIRGGVSSEKLMFNAGVALREAHPFDGKTAIVCGKGNNAGDGYVLAALLKREGKDCRLFLAEDAFSPDGRNYYKDCAALGVPSERITEETDLSPYNTVVDCLFGTGFKGEPHGVYKTAIEAINRSGAYVVSVDINSGLNGDNGLGTTVVQSDLTVALGGYKSGLFLNQSKDFIRALVSVPIGIHAENTNLFVSEDTDFIDFLLPRKNFSHKGGYGYVGVFGGSTSYAGALKLSYLSLAALRGGCGVSTVVAEEETAKAVAPIVLESTVLSLQRGEEKEILRPWLRKWKALSVGMGWGTDVSRENYLRFLLDEYEGYLILDADALNVSAKYGISLKGRKCTVIVTPHLGEMARLTGLSVSEIRSDPIRHARAFAEENGCITVLKGTATVVSDGKKTVLSTRGAAGMATAGSGDVLSGILTGVFGQNPSDPLSAAVYGVYLNGLSGEIAQNEVGDISMTSADTVRCIPSAIRYLRKQCGINA